MPGIVTEYLLQQIAKQVDDHGLVVWYDPEGDYEHAAASLALPDTTIANYDGSFFQLRREIDPLLNELQPPRLLVYVPVERTETHSALVELESAGVIMQPRQQPPVCNTRLSVVGRNALKPILGEDQVADIERQVEAGTLSLADLNELAEKGKDLSTGVLALIFGSANPQEVALAFLHSDEHDDQIGKKDAAPQLGRLLQISFDIELPAADSLPVWRMKLRRHVLLTDLFAALRNQVPAKLSSVPVAHSPGGIEVCVRLARTWRNDRDVRESYVAAANKVEHELALGQLDLATERLEDNETFHCVERLLLAHAEKTLVEAATPELLHLAERRMTRFWADVLPAVQARWALVASAARVLIEADRVEKAIKTAPKTVPELVKAYAGDDEPWCLLDTHHRHMETRKYNFDFPADGQHDALDQLITRAEQRYAEVGSALAQHFVTAFSKAKHPIAGLPRQLDVFETHVRPELRDKRIAYVWVDALRFEMARELAGLLESDFELTVQAALGTIPTITEIGMAALLPRAGKSAKVVAVGSGKLGLQIDRSIIKNRMDRVAFLKEHAGVPVFDAKLDDLLPKPPKRVKDGIAAAQLVLITSQEIDELGEGDNIHHTRRQMDGVLNDLRRGFRVLAGLGIKTIILTADHGHLFGEEIGEDMKIEAPGGDTADLHRRVWLGVGGTSEPSYLRTSLASLGIDSDLDIATPWTLACFKSKGGARAYFHGGLSPQELIIPIVVMTPAARGLAAPPTGISWTLAPGSRKLSTRYFSVQVSGQASGLFGVEPPKVRVEIRAKGKCVSEPVSASYGFEPATGDVQLRPATADAKQIEPNTVTLMVEVEQIGQKTVSISLLDTTSGAELANMDKIEVTNIM